MYYGHRTEVESDDRTHEGSGRFADTASLTGDDEYQLDLLGAEYRGPIGGLEDATLKAWVEKVRFRQDTVDERTRAERPVRIDRRFRYRQDTRGLSLDLRHLARTARSRTGLGSGVKDRQQDRRAAGRERGGN